MNEFSQRKAVETSAKPAADSPLASYQERVAAGHLELDAAQRGALTALEELHTALRRWRPPSRLGRVLARREAPASLYLHGPVGRGKSMLMDLFCETAPVAQRCRVHFHAFMQEVHATLHEWRRDPPRNRRPADSKGDDLIPLLAARLAAQTRLLCLDELEIIDIADAMIVARLFTALLDKDVVVVATSNYPPDRLYERGLNRQLFLPFIDLVNSRFRLVCLESERDYRRGSGEVPGYLTPSGPETRARMDRLFATACDGAAPEAMTLHHKGRTLTVPAAAAGVARFSFDDLCRQPLGTADYLSLAGRFQTIMIDDIPILSRDDRDAARRFATLIDVLYDHGTVLLCSAAAPPEELFAADAAVAETPRTVSRLYEMARQGVMAREPSS